VWFGLVLRRGRQVLENGGGLSQGGMMEMVLSGGQCMYALFIDGSQFDSLA